MQQRGRVDKRLVQAYSRGRKRTDYLHRRLRRRTAVRRELRRQLGRVQQSVREFRCQLRHRSPAVFLKRELPRSVGPEPRYGAVGQIEVPRALEGLLLQRAEQRLYDRRVRNNDDVSSREGHHPRHRRREPAARVLEFLTAWRWERAVAPPALVILRPEPSDLVKAQPVPFARVHLLEAGYDDRGGKAHELRSLAAPGEYGAKALADAQRRKFGAQKRRLKPAPKPQGQVRPAEAHSGPSGKVRHPVPDKVNLSHV